MPNDDVYTLRRAHSIYVADIELLDVLELVCRDLSRLLDQYGRESEQGARAAALIDARLQQARQIAVVASAHREDLIALHNGDDRRVRPVPRWMFGPEKKPDAIGVRDLRESFWRLQNTRWV